MGGLDSLLNAGVPQYGASPANPGERAARLLRALVFAAKSDGHINAKLRQNG